MRDRYENPNHEVETMHVVRMRARPKSKAPIPSQARTARKSQVIHDPELSQEEIVESKRAQDMKNSELKKAAERDRIEDQEFQRDYDRELKLYKAAQVEKCDKCKNKRRNCNCNDRRPLHVPKKRSRTPTEYDHAVVPSQKQASTCADPKATQAPTAVPCQAQAALRTNEVEMWRANLLTPADTIVEADPASVATRTPAVSFHARIWRIVGKVIESLLMASRLTSECIWTDWGTLDDILGMLPYSLEHMAAAEENMPSEALDYLTQWRRQRASHVVLVCATDTVEVAKMAQPDAGTQASSLHTLPLETRLGDNLTTAAPIADTEFTVVGLSQLMLKDSGFMKELSSVNPVQTSAGHTTSEDLPKVDAQIELRGCVNTVTVNGRKLPRPFKVKQDPELPIRHTPIRPTMLEGKIVTESDLYVTNEAARIIDVFANSNCSVPVSAIMKHAAARRALASILANVMTDETAALVTELKLKTKEHLARQSLDVEDTAVMTVHHPQGQPSARTLQLIQAAKDAGPLPRQLRQCLTFVLHEPLALFVTHPDGRVLQYTTMKYLIDTGANAATLAPEVYRKMMYAVESRPVPIQGASGSAMMIGSIPAGVVTMMLNPSDPEKAFAYSPEFLCAGGEIEVYDVVCPTHALMAMGAIISYGSPPTMTFQNASGTRTVLYLRNGGEFSKGVSANPLSAMVIDMETEELQGQVADINRDVNDQSQLAAHHANVKQTVRTALIVTPRNKDDTKSQASSRHPPRVMGSMVWVAVAITETGATRDSPAKAQIQLIDGDPDQIMEDVFGYWPKPSEYSFDTTAIGDQCRKVIFMPTLAPNNTLSQTHNQLLVEYLRVVDNLALIIPQAHTVEPHGRAKVAKMDKLVPLPARTENGMRYTFVHLSDTSTCSLIKNTILPHVNDENVNILNEVKQVGILYSQTRNSEDKEGGANDKMPALRPQIGAIASPAWRAAEEYILGKPKMNTIFAPPAQHWKPPLPPGPLPSLSAGTYASTDLELNRICINDVPDPVYIHALQDGVILYDGLENARRKKLRLTQGNGGALHANDKPDDNDAQNVARMMQSAWEPTGSGDNAQAVKTVIAMGIPLGVANKVPNLSWHIPWSPSNRERMSSVYAPNWHRATPDETASFVRSILDIIPFTISGAFKTQTDPTTGYTCAALKGLHRKEVTLQVPLQYGNDGSCISGRPSFECTEKMMECPGYRPNAESVALHDDRVLAALSTNTGAVPVLERVTLATIMIGAMLGIEMLHDGLTPHMLSYSLKYFDAAKVFDDYADRHNMGKNPKHFIPKLDSLMPKPTAGQPRYVHTDNQTRAQGLIDLVKHAPQAATIQLLKVAVTKAAMTRLRRKSKNASAPLDNAAEYLESMQHVFITLCEKVPPATWSRDPIMFTSIALQSIAMLAQFTPLKIHHVVWLSLFHKKQVVVITEYWQSSALHKKTLLIQPDGRAQQKWKTKDSDSDVGATFQATQPLTSFVSSADTALMNGPEELQFHHELKQMVAEEELTMLHRSNRAKGIDDDFFLATKITFTNVTDLDRHDVMDLLGARSGRISRRKLAEGCLRPTVLPKILHMATAFTPLNNLHPAMIEVCKATLPRGDVGRWAPIDWRSGTQLVSSPPGSDMVLEVNTVIVGSGQRQRGHLKSDTTIVATWVPAAVLTAIAVAIPQAATAQTITPEQTHQIEDNWRSSTGLIGIMFTLLVMGLYMVSMAVTNWLHVDKPQLATQPERENDVSDADRVNCAAAAEDPAAVGSEANSTAKSEVTSTNTASSCTKPTALGHQKRILNAVTTMVYWTCAAVLTAQVRVSGTPNDASSHGDLTHAANDEVTQAIAILHILYTAYGALSRCQSKLKPKADTGDSTLPLERMIECVLKTAIIAATVALFSVLIRITTLWGITLEMAQCGILAVTIYAMGVHNRYHQHVLSSVDVALVNVSSAAGIVTLFITILAGIATFIYSSPAQELQRVANRIESSLIVTAPIATSLALLTTVSPKHTAGGRKVDRGPAANGHRKKVAVVMLLLLAMAGKSAVSASNAEPQIAALNPTDDWTMHRSLSETTWSWFETANQSVAYKDRRKIDGIPQQNDILPVSSDPHHHEHYASVAICQGEFVALEDWMRDTSSDANVSNYPYPSASFHTVPTSTRGSHSSVKAIRKTMRQLTSSGEHKYIPWLQELDRAHTTHATNACYVLSISCAHEWHTKHAWVHYSKLKNVSHNGTHLSESQIQLLRRALGQTGVAATPAPPDEDEVIQVHATNPSDKTQSHQPQSKRRRGRERCAKDAHVVCTQSQNSPTDCPTETEPEGDECRAYRRNAMPTEKDIQAVVGVENARNESAAEDDDINMATKSTIPTEDDIAAVVAGNDRRPMGTTIDPGPYSIENLDPRSNGQKPQGGAAGIKEAVPLDNKMGYGYTIERREDITPEEYTMIEKRMAALEDCFAQSMKDLTGYKNTKFDIEFEDESSKAYQRWRHLAGPQKEFADKICAEMLEAGVIEKAPVHLKHCANVVIAPKKDPDTGQWSLLRFCVDLRMVNTLTKKQPRAFPIPEDMFKDIGHHKFYCALDLKAGFHQILCTERAKEKLTFWWNGIAYRFIRMPFGAVNSPAVFQSAVEQELAGQEAYSKVYIDDVLVWGDTVEETMDRLEKVLRALNDSGLKAHPGKTTIFASGIEYLGFLITKDGMQPQQAKVEAIKRIPKPTTVAEVQSFLGLITYYRWFIQKYSEIAAPLRNLTKKEANVVNDWTEEHDKAFEKIKGLLCTEGVGIKRFDPARPTFIHTDWSKLGISAVMTQYYEEEDTEYLVLATSRSCNKHEKRYPPFYGEMLAATWGVNKLRAYLYGHPFTLVTDHKPITYLMHKPDGLSDMHQRWQMQLQEYSFDVVHRAGKNHEIADVPSRFPLPSTTDSTGACLDQLSAADLEKEQRAFKQNASEKQIVDDIANRKDDEGDKEDRQLRFIAERMTAAHAAQRASKSPREAQQAAEQEEDAAHAILLLEKNDPPWENLFVPNISAQAKAHAPSCQPSSKSCAEGEDDKQASNVEEVSAESYTKHPTLSEETKIQQHDISKSWMPAAAEKGICVLDMCGNTSTALEAVLKAGWKVSKYIYVDPDTEAQKVARATVSRLLEAYPKQLHVSAADAFDNKDCPMDINDWNESVISKLIKDSSELPWLVCCGWPCQDNSPGGVGKGELGKRSTLIEAVIPLIATIQRQKPMTAYFLENTAIQHNWKDKPKWDALLLKYNRRMGKQICVDAARFGSAAHRVRNYWTNLGNSEILQGIIDKIHVPTRPIAKMLEPGAHTTIAAKDDMYPFYKTNKKGDNRKALPTFTSYPKSRAFKMLKDDQGNLVIPGQGMVKDKGGYWREPFASEKAVIMGHDENMFMGSGLTETQQLDLIGRSWDLQAVVGIFTVTRALHEYAQDTTTNDISVNAVAYHYELDDFRTSDHAGDGYGDNTGKKWAEELHRILLDTSEERLVKPRVPMEVSNSKHKDKKPGVGMTPRNEGKQSQLKNQKATFPTLGHQTNHEDGPWWRERFVQMDTKAKTTVIPETVDAACPTSEPVSTVLNASDTPFDMGASIALHTGGPTTLQEQRWDPWEDDGKWVNALLDPMGKAAALLHKQDKTKWQQMRTRFTVETDYDGSKMAAGGADRLWKVEGIHKKLVPRPEMRKKLITEIHGANGHWGINRTHSLMSKSYWMPKMKELVGEVVRGCEACQRVKVSFDGYQPTMNPLPVMGLCYRWSLDLATMPYDSERGNKYVVVMIEHYSKYIELAAIPTKEAKYVAAAFRERVIARHGGCAEVLTDNGGEFSAEFDVLLEKNFIDHRLITPHHSQSNGLAERCVQTVKRALKRMGNGHKNRTFQWDDELAYIQLGYNCSKQEATKIAPYTLTYAHEPIFPSEASAHFLKTWEPTMDKEAVINGINPEEDLLERSRLLKRYNIIAGQNLAIAQHRDTARYAMVRGGTYRPNVYKFQKGDYVWVKHKNADALQLPTRGVYRIASLKDNGVVELEGSDGGKFKDSIQLITPCHVPLQHLEGAPETAHKEVGEDLQCELCHSPDDSADMLLCDSCDTGWHMKCLLPPLTEVPEDNWFCPNCSNKGNNSKWVQAKGNIAATHWADGRLIHRLHKVQGELYEGIKVSKRFQGKRYQGVLHYLENPKDENLKGTFRVLFEDGDEEFNDIIGLQADKKFKILEKLPGQVYPTEAQVERQKDARLKKQPAIRAQVGNVPVETVNTVEQGPSAEQPKWRWSNNDTSTNGSREANTRKKIKRRGNREQRTVNFISTDPAETTLADVDAEDDTQTIDLNTPHLSVNVISQRGKDGDTWKRPTDNDTATFRPAVTPTKLNERLTVRRWWDPTSATEWGHMLNALVPTDWPLGTLTRKANAVKRTVVTKEGQFLGKQLRHATTKEEINVLIPHVKWEQLQHGLDAWCGDRNIAKTLRNIPECAHINIHNNDLDTTLRADSHKDSLQPGNWLHWMRGKMDFVITSPLFVTLDVAVPIMAMFCKVLFVHVPGTWVFSATDRRKAWLNKLKSEGRLQVIMNLPRGNSGAWRGCWLIIVADRQQRERLMHNQDDFMI